MDDQVEVTEKIDDAEEEEFKLFDHERRIWPKGYADEHRPAWHLWVYGSGERP